MDKPSKGQRQKTDDKTNKTQTKHKQRDIQTNRHTGGYTQYVKNIS